jgi:hypothetical protein
MVQCLLFNGVHLAEAEAFEISPQRPGSLEDGPRARVKWELIE